MTPQFQFTTSVGELRGRGRRLRQRLRTVVEETAESILERTREEMRGPKSGRWYGAHQASAPGEAPAIDTEDLLKSGHVEPAPEGDLAADVVFDDPAAAPMEYGAPAAHIEPRPFLQPAMMAELEPMRERLAQALNGE